LIWGNKAKQNNISCSKFGIERGSSTAAGAWNGKSSSVLSCKAYGPEESLTPRHLAPYCLESGIKQSALTDLSAI